VFCKETVRDLRRSSESGEPFPRSVFVHIGGAKARARFFDAMWPGAAVIDDPERTLYQAFGLGRGSLRQLLGLDVWKAGMRAIGKGESLALPQGDVWVMPGEFLVDDRGVLWAHTFEHAGDIPDMQVIRDQYARWTGAS
jgi:hypothetical protein